MLFLSIIFLLHVVAVVTSSTSCLVQTCLASQGGNTVVGIYDTAVPYASGTDDAAEIANYLTLQCGLNANITKCYVDCNGIYGETGAYWTVQNCQSQCTTTPGAYSCAGVTKWFCSIADSNVCQLAAPSTPTDMSIATATATGLTAATETAIGPAIGPGVGLSRSETVAIGTSLGIGIPGLILAAYGLRIAIKQYNLAKRGGRQNHWQGGYS